MKKLFICLGILLFSTPWQIQAEVEYSLVYEYYPVPYSPDISVNEMIVKHTPLKLSDGVNHAVGTATSSFWPQKVKFNQPYVGDCQIENPGVVAKCTVNLAKLEGGDEATAARFNASVEKTRQHELQHCAIGLKHAKILEERLMKIGKKPCNKIWGVMKKEYDKVRSDCRREQKEFDYHEYGQEKQLRAESLLQFIDSGGSLKPDDKFIHRLPKPDYTKREVQTLINDREQLKNDGFYKDKDGVWRNR